MRQTAAHVAAGGGQLEVVLRVRQGRSPLFAFLLPGDRLHPFFRWLVRTAPRGPATLDSAPGADAPPPPPPAPAALPPPPPLLPPPPRQEEEEEAEVLFGPHQQQQAEGPNRGGSWEAREPWLDLRSPAVLKLMRWPIC